MPRRLLAVLLVVLMVSLLLLCACSAAAFVRRRGRCTGHDALMSISAGDTIIRVGDTSVVTVTLHNTGCASLGLPEYRLYVEPDGQDVLVPAAQDPVLHSLGLDRGESDSTQFTLRAVAVGKVTLRAVASFEVHLGYPGPAYWAGSGTDPLEVTVVR